MWCNESMPYKLSFSLVSLFYLLSASGCTTSGWSNANSLQDDSFLISRGIIKNTSRYEISDVNILHLPTRAIAGVSAILPHTAAEMGISPRKLKADSAVLTWHQQAQQYEVKLVLPKEPVRSESTYFMIVYEIFPGGEAVVSLMPDSKVGL